MDEDLQADDTPLIKVSFVFYSEDDAWLNEDQPVLSKCFDRFWRKGEQVGKSRILYKHNGAKISGTAVPSWDLGEEVNLLLRRIEPHAELIKSMRSKWNLNVEIACQVMTASRAPAVHLDVEIMKKLVEFHAELDVDII